MPWAFRVGCIRSAWLPGLRSKMRAQFLPAHQPASGNRLKGLRCMPWWAPHNFAGTPHNGKNTPRSAAPQTDSGHSCRDSDRMRMELLLSFPFNSTPCLNHYFYCLLFSLCKYFISLFSSILMSIFSHYLLRFWGLESNIVLSLFKGLGRGYTLSFSYPYAFVVNP